MSWEGLTLEFAKRARRKPLKIEFKAGAFEQPAKAATKRLHRAIDEAGTTSQLIQFPDLKNYTPEQRKTILTQQLARVRKINRKRGDTFKKGDVANEDDPYTRLVNTLNSKDRKQFALLERVGREEGVAKDAARFRHITGAREVKREDLQAQLMRAYDEQWLAQRGAEAKKSPEAKHMKLSGKTKLLGVSVPGLHQGLYFADQVLDKLQRPVNFVSGAAYAAHQGKPILKTAGRSFLHKKGETYTMSDVLEAKGVTGATKFIGALGGDILFNPLNLVTAGIAAPAQAATKTAARLGSQARELRAAGDVAKAAKLERKAEGLTRKAIKLPTNKGIQVGLRVGAGGRELKLMTSGKLSAKALKALGLSKTATAIRESRPVQALGQAVAPDFRPAGLTDNEWKAYRDRHRQARATTAQGSKYWERRARAYTKQLGAAAKTAGLDTGRAHDEIVAALERAPRDPLGPRVPGLGEAASGEHSIHGLHESLRPLAVQLRADFKAIGQTERDAKVLGDLRDLYAPHQLTTAARKALAKDGRRSTSSKANPYALRRRDERSVKEINAELEALGRAPMFDTNVGKLLANRGAKSSQVLANRNFAQNVADDVGRKLRFSHDANGVPRPVLDDLREIDDVFVLGHKTAANPTGFRHIGRDEGSIVKAAMSLDKGERFVVLPKAIGDGVLKGAVHGAAKDQYGFLHAYDRALGAIKSALTVLNVPAYDLRNLAGDLWNAHLADTDAKSIVDGVRLIKARTGRNIAQGKHVAGEHTVDGEVTLHNGLRVDRDDFIREMEREGVIDQGYYGHELRDYEEHTSATARATQSLGRRPVESLRRVGNFREDMVRAGTYLSARRRGMSPSEAAQWTNRHHFDYGDLTDFERNALRRVFPFYTFTARNTRLQGSKILARPGKYSNYGLVQEEARKEAGLPERWKQDLPGYARRGLPIPVKIGGKLSLITPQLPITDIGRITALSDPVETFQLTNQMLSPPAKWILEPLMNYSFFFRDPLWADDEHPDAPHLVPAPWYVEQLPLAARTALAGGNEEAAKQGFWTAKADYAARLTPQQNFATQVATAKVGTRNQTAEQALVSQLTGVKINEYPAAKKRERDAKFDQIDDLTRQIEDLEDLDKRHTAEYKRLSKKKRALLDQLFPRGQTKKPRPFGSTSSGGGRPFGATGRSGSTYGAGG